MASPTFASSRVAGWTMAWRASPAVFRGSASSRARPDRSERALRRSRRTSSDRRAAASRWRVSGSVTNRIRRVNDGTRVPPGRRASGAHSVASGLVASPDGTAPRGSPVRSGMAAALRIRAIASIRRWRSSCATEATAPIMGAHLRHLRPRGRIPASTSFPRAAGADVSGGATVTMPWAIGPIPRRRRQLGLAFRTTADASRGATNPLTRPRAGNISSDTRAGVLGRTAT